MVFLYRPGASVTTVCRVARTYSHEQRKRDVTVPPPRHVPRKRKCLKVEDTVGQTSRGGWSVPLCLSLEALCLSLQWHHCRGQGLRLLLLQGGRELPTFFIGCWERLWWLISLLLVLIGVF